MILYLDAMQPAQSKYPGALVWLLVIVVVLFVLKFAWDSITRPRR